MGSHKIWFPANKLLLHVKKSKFMVFKPRQKILFGCSIDLSVKIGKTRNCVKTLCPAGVVFPHNFSFFQFPFVLI